jgi:hypothetical protein
MNLKSYQPFDRRGRELGARRSPPARFSSLPTRSESLSNRNKYQTPLTQISLQNPKAISKPPAMSSVKFGEALGLLFS